MRVDDVLYLFATCELSPVHIYSHISIINTTRLDTGKMHMFPMFKNGNHSTPNNYALSCITSVLYLLELGSFNKHAEMQSEPVDS